MATPLGMRASSVAGRGLPGGADSFTLWISGAP